MIGTIFGTKLASSQGFSHEGKRIPLTKVRMEPMWVVQVKTGKKDGYEALQLGIGQRKREASRPLAGHIKGANLKSAPLYLREVRVKDAAKFKVGEKIEAEKFLKAGDLVDVVGISKGKGFAGVVKRFHFAGGPRTHGQSDRERRIGAIGQGTDPGRVHKGKKMPGHMGSDMAVVKNSQVLEIDAKEGVILVKGGVPGAYKSLVTLVKRTGTGKAKFSPLLKKGEELLAAEVKEFVAPKIAEGEVQESEQEKKTPVQAVGPEAGKENG